jgi:ubiquinone/menaquinone biosynthesis C-methylase UbiE
MTTEPQRTASERFDRIASNYVTSEVHRSSPTITRALELLGSARRAAVCDVACGAGHFALAFGGTTDRLVAVDPSRSMLEAVRQQAAARGIAIETVEAFAEAIPLPNSAFDVVVTRLAAHHFSDVERAVREMARILAPGGRLVVIDLEGNTDPTVDTFNHRLELLHDPTHVRSYTARSWQRFVEQAGLRIVALERELSERPAGITVKRWCEIASSGAEAERQIVEALSSAPPAYREALGIASNGQNFLIPVRTCLVVALKEQ